MFTIAFYMKSHSKSKPEAQMQLLLSGNIPHLHLQTHLPCW